MSQLQQFRDFVNERLAVAALEIYEQYEKAIAESQEEICRSREKSTELQKLLDLRSEITLHQTDMKIVIGDPPQIKEEPELWSGPGGELLPGLQSDGSASLSTARVGAPCGLEDSSPLPPGDQTVEIRGDYSANVSEDRIIIKIEAGSEEDYESASDPQTTPTPGQSSEWEGAGGGPELLASSLNCLPTKVPNLTIQSRKTQGKCFRRVLSSGSKPGPRLWSRPSPWTRPTPTSFSGSHSEDVSQREAESRKPYRCEECNKAFSQKAHLTKHRRIHTGDKPYQCEHCSQAFSQKGNLVMHRRIHTGEKPYQCEQCSQAFSRKSSLFKHKMIHTGEKPYQCEECDKTFTRKNHLADHRIIHTGHKQHQCEHCGQAFSQKGNLVNHRRIHTGEKPYQCEQCDQAFTQKGNLVQHKRIHTGEKPYQCGECKKAFSRKTSFMNHRRIHTGEKPYQCERCDKAFSQKSHLVKHRIWHTAVSARNLAALS